MEIWRNGRYGIIKGKGKGEGEGEEKMNYNEKLEARLEFGIGAPIINGQPTIPRTTRETDIRVTEQPKYWRTVTGYGKKLPTEYMVRHNGKWRRVYAVCYSNSASHYIGKLLGNGQTIFVSIYK